MKRHTDKTQTGETNIEFCWPKSFQCTNSTLTYVTGMNCLLGRILQRFFGRSLQQFFGRSLQQFFGRTLQHFSAELCNIFRSTFCNLPGRTVAEKLPGYWKILIYICWRNQNKDENTNPVVNFHGVTLQYPGNFSATVFIVLFSVIPVLFPRQLIPVT